MSENILFLAFIPLFFILFLALIYLRTSVRDYISARYKAEFRNALHILLHNSKPRINKALQDLPEPLPYPVFAEHEFCKHQ